MFDHSVQKLTVEQVDSEGSFAALDDEWRALVRSTGAPSVFHTHEWLSAAWQWRKLDSELRIIIVRSNSELVGACPLVSSTVRRGFISLRALEYLAVPDTQECVFLARPGSEAVVHDAVLDYLSRQDDWDTCEIGQIPHDSYTWRHLTDDALYGNSGIIFKPGGNNPSVRLTGTWSEYYARRSKRLRKGNNHIANKLKRKYDQISIECLRYSPWPDDAIHQVREILTDISISSWKSQQTETSFGEDGPGAWLDELFRDTGPTGWLAVWLLMLDGKCAATELQLIHGGIVSALRADFDESIKELSPGAYLNWKILERLFEYEAETLTEYRMGPGTNPYKARWSEEEHRLGNAVIYNDTISATLVRILDERIKPILRTMRTRLLSLKGEAR